MKITTIVSRLVLVLVASVHGCLAALGQANQIADLLTTNRPGQYRLKPAWVGQSEEIFATGFFATQSYRRQQERSERALRFDLFSYFEKPLPAGSSSRVISQSVKQTADEWQHFKLHSYRALFPTDTQLTNAHTVAALTNLLGSSQGFTTAWGLNGAIHSSATWQLFRFRHNTTLETLSVFCFTSHTNGQPGIYVDSITIRRGTARPEE